MGLLRESCSISSSGLRATILGSIKATPPPPAFPFIVLKPRVVPSVLMSHSCSLPIQEKKSVLFAHSISPLVRVFAHRERITTILELLSLQCQSLMVACRLYYDISLGTWETGPFLDDIFLISRKFHLVLYGKILIQHWVRPHVPSKPSRRRPAAALKLGSEGSMLSGSYTVQL